MPITFTIPPRLQAATEDKPQISIAYAETLLDALLQLSYQFPDLKNSMFDSNNRLSPYFRISINDVLVTELNTPLNSNCDIVIIGAIAGG